MNADQIQQAFEQWWFEIEGFAMRAERFSHPGEAARAAWNQAFALHAEADARPAIKGPHGEAACYAFGYSNPSLPSRCVEWPHVVYTNAFWYGQCDRQNQQPLNTEFSREQYDEKTGERLMSPVATAAAGEASDDGLLIKLDANDLPTHVCEHCGDGDTVLTFENGQFSSNCNSCCADNDYFLMEALNKLLLKQPAAPEYTEPKAGQHCIRCGLTLGGTACHCEENRAVLAQCQRFDDKTTELLAEQRSFVSQVEKIGRQDGLPSIEYLHKMPFSKVTITTPAQPAESAEDDEWVVVVPAQQPVVDAKANPECDICHNTGLICVGISGLESDGNAPVTERCPGYGYGEEAAAAFDRTDWTPEEALRWYAAGKHFDTVNGRTRILDTGAIASHALKRTSPEYHAMKGADASYPAPAAEAAQAWLSDEQREKVHDAVRDALGNAHDCKRIWSAWRMGTMSEDDFVLVTEDDSRVAEIADAAIDAILAAAGGNHA
ncbi:hypothetical protein ACSI5F_03665 [Ralstonia pseudosolanacearum]|uniref:hypothetical protein n=1 Tax=Ralstonia pseudosolanacearum TaxID=1310165 RepID=UPI003EE0E5A5